MNNSPDSRSMPHGATLRVLIVLSGIEYGIILFLGCIVPSVALYLQGESTFFSIYRALIIFSLAASAVGAGGTLLMRRSLKSINDQVQVRVWSMSALMMAPFSAIFHSIIIQQWPMMGIENYVILKIGAFCVGLCMPFILLTLWLRYKYRQDEF